MDKYSNFKEVDKYMSEMNKFKVKCRCGRKMILINGVDKVVCDWCGNYVYKDKKIEFRERMKKCLKKKQKENMSHTKSMMI